MLWPQLKNGMNSAWLLCQSFKQARVSKGIELIQSDLCLQSCLAREWKVDKRSSFTNVETISDPLALQLSGQHIYLLALTNALPDGEVESLDTGTIFGGLVLSQEI